MTRIQGQAWPRDSLWKTCGALVCVNDLEDKKHSGEDRKRLGSEDRGAFGVYGGRSMKRSLPRGATAGGTVYGANAGISINSADFARLARAFEKLPDEMQRQVMARAFGRSKDVVERTYSRLAAERMDIAQKHIKARTRTFIRTGDMLMIVKSQQIPLRELNPKQNTIGVKVPMRKSYRAAFIAKAKSGKALVLRRPGAPGSKAPRYPVMELHGPNPAGEANRSPQTYETMLGDIARGVFFNEMARGISFMLGRL